MFIYLSILLLWQGAASQTYWQKSIPNVSRADISIVISSGIIRKILHATPTERTERRSLDTHEPSIVAHATVKTIIVTASTSNVPMIGAGIPRTTDEARAADVSPADSPAKQDVLRNTLIGVLGLLLSAGSLVVAIQHNRRNACRQQDLESSPSVNHVELRDVGEDGTQGGDRSPENVGGSTNISHASQGGGEATSNNPGDASLKITDIVFKAMRSCSSASGRTFPFLKLERTSEQQQPDTNAEQMSSCDSAGETTEPVVVQPSIDRQREAVEHPGQSIQAQR